MENYKFFSIAMLLIMTASMAGCVEKTLPQMQTNVVEITSFSFQPDSITVSPGTAVTWVNNDPVEHTVTSSDGTFSSGNMAAGGRFNFVFTKPGRYQYQCLIHPSMMGYVIVADASGKTDPSKVNSTDPGTTEMDAGNVMTNQSGPMVALKLVASGFAAPMEFVSSKDGRMFVVDQTGLVKLMTADGKLQEEPFLNVSDRMVKISPRYDERGLLGLAFHPNFARNGRVFVFYSAPLRSGAPQGWNCTNKLSEFLVTNDNPKVIDMNSEKVILEIHLRWRHFQGFQDDGEPGHGPALVVEDIAAMGEARGQGHVPAAEGGRGDHLVGVARLVFQFQGRCSLGPGGLPGRTERRKMSRWFGARPMAKSRLARNPSRESPGSP